MPPHAHGNRQVDASHFFIGLLGPEALYALEIVAFPVVVIIDRHGGNFHEIARARWRKAR